LNTVFTELQTVQILTIENIDNPEQTYYLCCKGCTKDFKLKRMERVDALLFLSKHIGHDTRMLALIRGKKID
jgi:hypothetical protein